MPSKIRSAHSPRVRVQLDTGSKGGAKQSFKDEADINFLMARYLKTGVISSLNPREATFMDVSECGTFADVMERMREGTVLFESLPSEIREQFNHDPGAFLDFAGDPENADELVELGIVSPAESDSDPQDPPPAVEPSGGSHSHEGEDGGHTHEPEGE